MLDFSVGQSKNKKEKWIVTSLCGKPLLTTPQLNKGTAFSIEERLNFGLIGKLPARVETLEEQVKRAYQQYKSYRTRLKRHIYLNDLHDRNQILFYKLVSSHLTEMLPIIYTPIVGKAVKKFSHEFRQPRGLYISYPEIDYIDEILDNRSNPDIKLIVVTDGEGVLGIGDQGIGGMDIPVAKLMVYSLCGGVDPTYTLPILLDIGTNNQTLLADPLYLGWRHPRIQGAEYDRFVDRFIDCIQKKFPRVFLHWEDFGRANAQRYLERYENRLCTFNDDIQGTGIVTLAALLAASEIHSTPLSQQRIVIYGAGTAGCGIADQIYTTLTNHFGVESQNARKQFWLIDQHGLLISDQKDLTSAQKPFARDRHEIAEWDQTDLATVVKQIKPTILIGCSAHANAFTESIIREMATHVARPVILPLSNPTEQAEAKPADLVHWTEGRALIATGSPFPNVKYQKSIFSIAQCNNALVFPGIGLGIIAVQAKKLTESMIWAACKTIAHHSPALKKVHAPLLPAISNAKQLAQKIAIAVAEQAIKENVARCNEEIDLKKYIKEIFWDPCYLPYKKK